MAIRGRQSRETSAQGGKGSNKARISLIVEDDPDSWTWVVEKIRKIQSWVNDSLFEKGVDKISVKGAIPLLRSRSSEEAVSRLVKNCRSIHF